MFKIWHEWFLCLSHCSNVLFFFCVYGLCLHVCVWCVHIEASRGCCVLLYHSVLFPWDKAIYWSWNWSQRACMILSLSYRPYQVLRLRIHKPTLGFLFGCKGFELRSSCMCRNLLYSLVYIPSSFIFFLYLFHSSPYKHDTLTLADSQLYLLNESRYSMTFFEFYFKITC